jgi:hypothetical protein
MQCASFVGSAFASAAKAALAAIRALALDVMNGQPRFRENVQEATP